jgi:kynurenine formamidase
MLKAENVTPRRGDILFVRTGMVPEWDAFTDEQKKAYAAQQEPEHAGVEASIELLEWLWDSGITAVAGDAISWEVSCSSESLLSAFLLFRACWLIVILIGLPHTRQGFSPRVSARWVGYAYR